MAMSVACVLFGLYFVSLMVSTAGMEFFSSTVAAFFLYQLGMDLYQRRPGRILAILKQPIILFALAFLVFSVISAVFSPVAITPLIKMIGINRNILLLIAYLYLFPKLLLHPPRRWLEALFFVFIMVAAYAFYQCFTGVDLIRIHSPFLERVSGMYRAIGFFAIPLTFAYSFGMVFYLLLPFLFSKFIKNSNLSFKLLYYVALCMIPFAVLASGTRGALLALALTSLLFILTTKNFKARVVFIVGLMLVALVIWQNPYLKRRVDSILDFSNTSNSARFVIWEANYAIFKDHFWFGAGPNQGDHLLPDYYEKLQLTPPQMLPPTHHAHNDFIQIAAGMGIFGLVTYLLMSIGFLWVALFAWLCWPEESSFQKKLALGSFLAQIYFHLGSLTQCNYIDIEVKHMLLVAWFVGFELYLLRPQIKTHNNREVAG